MTGKNVLVSGASFGGPTLAYWLARRGFDVTVVELASDPRGGGSPIDVRGTALGVAERMGIMPRILAVKTNTRGIEFVDDRGEPVATVDPDRYAEEPGQDVELERGALAEILQDATKDDVEYVFGDSIRTLTQDDDGVDVTFVRGADRRFDFIFGADGLHSAVRRLTFGDESQFVHHLGLYTALLQIDPNLGRTDWGVMHNSPGKLAGIYNYRGRSSAIFLFRSPELSYDYRDLDQQKKLLEEAYADEAWQVPELLAAALASDDLYFDSVSQVRMPSWSHGRVAVLGDAGYAPALLSGMGTTLAMVGADHLAEALATSDDHHQAFASYEQAHRPLVDKAQSGVMENADFLVPATAAGIERRTQLLRGA